MSRESEIAGRVASSCLAARGITSGIPREPVLMTVGRDSFNVRSINNRRFMYNPQSSEIVFGGSDVSRSSHAQEWHDLGAKGDFDAAVRGWIGYGGKYRKGIIHFAPPVESYNFSEGFDALEMFLRHGATEETVVRNFMSHGESTLGDILSGNVGGAKVAARPIHLDKTYVKQEADDLAAKIWGDVKNYPEGKPIEQYLVNFHVTVPAVTGEEIDTVVVLRAKQVVIRGRIPTWPQDVVLGGGSGKTPSKKPAILIEINGSYPPVAFSPEGRLKRELYTILLHEMTHIADKFAKSKKPTTRHVRTINEIDPVEYYNTPTEVRAYMQEVVEEVRRFFPQILPVHGRDDAMKYSLKMSDAWQKISPHLTRENHNKVLSAVWNSVQDFLEPQGMEKAARIAGLLSRAEYNRAFKSAKDSIDRLLADGKTEQAEDVFFRLCGTLRGLHDEIAGIRFFVRPDEKRKMDNLKQVLRRFRRQIDPDHYREWKSKFTTISLLRITMNDLSETFGYLMRAYDRLVDYGSIRDTFKHGPFSIVNTYGYRETEYGDILKVLDDAAARVEKAGYGKVLYGSVEFTTGLGAAGNYSSSSDIVRLNVLASYRYNNVYTLVHEFGHRYWHKVLSPASRDAYEGDFGGKAGYLTLEQRQDMWRALEYAKYAPGRAKAFLDEPSLFPELLARWKELVIKNGWRTKDISRNPDDFDWLYQNFVFPNRKLDRPYGEVRDVSVTSYGSTDTLEDFAEIFAHVVMGMPVAMDAEERFRRAVG